MENDFLHKISIEKLSKELNQSVDDIAVLAGIKQSKNLGKWAQGKPNGSRPNYNAIIKLLRAGATVETLFGVEYKGPVKPPVLGGPLPPEIANDPEHAAGMEWGLKDIEAKIEARVLARLKEKGLAPIPSGSDDVHIDLQDPKFQELVEKALLRIEERRKLNEKGVIK